MCWGGGYLPIDVCGVHSALEQDSLVRQTDMLRLGIRLRVHGYGADTEFPSKMNRYYLVIN